VANAYSRQPKVDSAQTNTAPVRILAAELLRCYRVSVPHRIRLDQESFDTRHPPALSVLCRYNRYVIRPTLIAAAALVIVLLAGCKKDIQSQEAVRQGVMSYLSKRSDLLAMDVSVSSVAFRQDEATAEVHFQAKGNSSPAAGMTMQYALERKDGQWVVKGRAGTNSAHGASAPGVNSVPGQGVLPGSLDGMPRIPTPGGAGSAGTLPPGHPSAGSSQALPPGHPSVSSDSTNQQR
jgi:hypothetical protein